MQSSYFKNSQSHRGFSLIEVVLAIGIFLVTVLALVGLLGPTLKSVDDVEKSDEVSSVVNTVNAFLQSSPDIAPTGSKFDAIYNAVKSGDYATIFVFRSFLDDSSTDVELKVGFLGETDATLSAADFSNIAGPIYRVVLTASSVTPMDELTETDDDGDGSPDRNSLGIYTLKNPLVDYREGYFAMEIRIFALETDVAEARAGGSGSIPSALDPSALKDIEPLFTYNTAVVR